MIKAVGTGARGAPVLALGLGTDEMVKLLAGGGLRVATGDLGLPEMEIMLASEDSFPELLQLLDLTQEGQ